MYIPIVYNPFIFTIAPILYINYIINNIKQIKYNQDANIINNDTNIINYVRLYNILQIILCSYMTYGLYPVISQGIYNPFGINIEYTNRLEWFTTIHYLSKYFDWIDTYIIIKRKKTYQLSLLHVYHHSSIVAVWGFMLFNGHGNGTVTFGAWINSLTHTLMYSHYLLTSFKIKNPFKKLLTMWQITQFYMCLIHGIIIIFIYPSWETYLPNKYAWLCVSYQSSLIILFTNYMNYVPNYLKINN